MIGNFKRDLAACRSRGSSAAAAKKVVKSGYRGEYGQQGKRCARISGCDIDEEAVEFLKACEAWKEQTGVRYLSHVDHLTIAKRMGYVKA